MSSPQLAERFGKDDEAVLQANEKTRIAIGDEQYMLTNILGRLGLFSSPETREKRAKKHRNTEFEHGGLYDEGELHASFFLRDLGGCPLDLDL